MLPEGCNRFVQLPPPGLKPNVTAVLHFNCQPNGRITLRLEINAAGDYLPFCIAPVDPVLEQSILPYHHLRGLVIASLTIKA